MTPGLLLFAALFAMSVSESLLRIVLRMVSFLLLTGPVAIAVTLYVESEGIEQSRNCGKHTAQLVSLSEVPA